MINTLIGNYIKILLHNKYKKKFQIRQIIINTLIRSYISGKMEVKKNHKILFKNNL